MFMKCLLVQKRTLCQKCLLWLKYKLRQCAPVLLLAACLCFLWFILGSKRILLTSSIGCKSKIAQISITSTDVRQTYLEPMGVNYRQLETDFYNYATTITYSCKNQVHVGPNDDGGWDVCLEQRFEMSTPCLIYSFGIGDDMRFENGLEALVACEIHSFDPSVGIETHQYSSNGYFYNVGIDGFDSHSNHGRWKLRRLQTLMTELGHHGRSLDYVKLDVEFSEWPTLYDLLNSRLIDSIRQMALEIHTPEMDMLLAPHHVCTWSTVESLSFMLRILIDLKNAGFMVFHTRTNHRIQYKSGLTHIDRNCCFDVHFVNVRHPDNSLRV